MKKKIVLTLTFTFLMFAVIFALGGTTLTGFLVSDTTQITPVNQIFSAIFLFLGLGIFIVGLLHD